MKRALVVSVHPDDETIGMGGTILKLKEQKNEVFWLNITNGNKQQEKYIPLVANYYSFSEFYCLGFPEIHLTDASYKELVPAINRVINSIKCDTIFLPNRSDIHTDHQVSFKAVMSACKSFRAEYVKTVLTYETLSETEFSPALPENVFIPNVFSDISTFIEMKIEALGIYKSELMGSNSPRSVQVVRALSKYRGSRIGVDYAESFMLLLGQI